MHLEKKVINKPYKAVLKTDWLYVLNPLNYNGLNVSMCMDICVYKCVFCMHVYGCMSFWDYIYVYQWTFPRYSWILKLKKYK